MARCPSGHESQTTDYCDTCGAVMGGAAITPSAAAGVAEGAGAAEAGGGAFAATATAGRPGEVCPVCGAARSGRFCEEDGYDFELAALVPPGAEPSSAEPSSAASGPLTPPPASADPLASTSVLGPDLDLEAELEKAERAAAAAAGSGASAAPDPGLSSSAPSESTPSAPAPTISEPVSPSAPTALAAVVHADQDYYTAQVQRGDIVESEFPFPKYTSERRFALSGDRVRIGRASASRGIVVEIDLTGPPLDPAVSHLHAQLLRAPDGTWSLVDLNSANGTRLNGAEDPLPAETEVPVKAGDRIHVGVWTTLTLEEA
ncbi:MAG TPA: FHA domain-containing protein [Actinocrinis sp.]|jgi:hypothetical protein|uniref:FHA domain-containing protein n=1 Tax=Actinocrinis sp. TaxID=1920516 RepID=UPI002DDC97CC|nr:FHA domain-containing protein [Actinocrinis sp.]HEV3169716.1 FHA domain-containing protein [Actinocrinis sp.]